MSHLDFINLFFFGKCLEWTEKYRKDGHGQLCENESFDYMPGYCLHGPTPGVIETGTFGQHVPPPICPILRGVFSLLPRPIQGFQNLSMLHPCHSCRLIPFLSLFCLHLTFSLSLFLFFYPFYVQLSISFPISFPPPHCHILSYSLSLAPSCYLCPSVAW